ncbi:MAG: hemerythrin [Anaerolineae bacterium]|nr:hemerythrin [Anaerolineae bacterium]
MTATEVLKTEHRDIRVMLSVLENVADRLEGGEAVPHADLEAMLDFIRTFADSLHHAKEEGLLFPALERAGFPRESGPVGVMLLEHDAGRGHTRGLAEAAERLQAGDAAAARQAAGHARAYVQLLDAHIYKEDNILFEMADMHLSEEEQKWLSDEFERVADRFGHDRHEEYHDLLHTLRDRYLS